MTEETANAFDEYSPNDVEVRDDYSGRCMVGAKTFAVCFPSAGEFQRALATVALHIGVEIGEINGHGCTPNGVYHDQMEAVAQELREGFATDSMGLGIVVY